MLVKRSIYLLLVHLVDHLSDQSGDSDCRNRAKERERVIEIGIAMVKSGRDRVYTSGGCWKVEIHLGIKRVSKQRAIQSCIPSRQLSLGSNFKPIPEMALNDFSWESESNLLDRE